MAHNFMHVILEAVACRARPSIEAASSIPKSRLQILPSMQTAVAEHLSTWPGFNAPCMSAAWPHVCRQTTQAVSSLRKG